jgi:hypothetical protein
VLFFLLVTDPSHKNGFPRADSGTEAEMRKTPRLNEIVDLAAVLRIPEQKAGDLVSATEDVAGEWFGVWLRAGDLRRAQYAPTEFAVLLHPGNEISEGVDRVRFGQRFIRFVHFLLLVIRADAERGAKIICTRVTGYASAAKLF